MLKVVREAEYNWGIYIFMSALGLWIRGLTVQSCIARKDVTSFIN